MNDLPWTLVVEPEQRETARLRIEEASVVGVDTEYDSFRYFREKLCLVQVSTDREVYLFDPLGPQDLSFLGGVFSNSDIIKVLHASDNDVRILHRDYDFTFSSIFDTHRAAALLGSTFLSLPAILKEYLNLELSKNKKIQRSRWDTRPLSDLQLDYAARDAACLLPLYRTMAGLLRERGLEEEARGQFDEVAAGRWREKRLVPGGFRKIEGYEDLDDEARFRLEALWRWRFEKARSTNRARFMILSDKNLVDLAREEVTSLDNLATSGLITSHQAREFGEELLQVLHRSCSEY